MENNILVTLVYWHYYEAPKFLLGVWKNFIQFSIDYFSTPLLLKTLFSPWRRYRWSFPRGFDVAGYANVIISNIFSRLLGAICRIFLIVIGVIIQILTVILGAVVLISWILLPIIMIFLLLFSLKIIY